MTISDSICNGYSPVYGKHFAGSKCSIAQSLTKNLDQHRKPFFANRRTVGARQFFSSPTRLLINDEYSASNEMMSVNPSWEAKIIQNIIYSRPTVSDIDWSLTCSPDAGGYFTASPLDLSLLELEKQADGIGSRTEDLSYTRELSLEFIPDEYRSAITSRSTDMWSLPLSPILQNTPSPVDSFSDLQSVLSNSMVWAEQRSELVEKVFDEVTDGSFLFVKTNNVLKLKEILRGRGLEVQDIGKTRTRGVLVVLFKSHEFAKRAFTLQKEIGLRMEPPSYTKRYWFKNPSPNFHVVFETTRRLTVKSGKSSSNVKIGDFLMMDARNGVGCIVWGDQMKGHRMRVVNYVGKFMQTDGRIVEKKSLSEPKIVGWISTQCHKTKEKLVLRKSMNKIQDYIYDDGMQAVE